MNIKLRAAFMLLAAAIILVLGILAASFPDLAFFTLLGTGGPCGWERRSAIDV